MAKFTVYFKDKVIRSEIYDSGVVHIGRDETNELAVDSLAFAPIHAVVVVKDNGSVIKQMNEKFPLLVNGVHTKECFLQNNDRIDVGKHLIVYNTTASFSESAQLSVPEAGDPEIDELNEKLDQVIRIPDANLQVLSGPHIGRILPLKKPMTRLGHNGGGVVVIARRKDGFFVSALEAHVSLTVNNRPLADHAVHLQNNDIIVIDKTSMQFFLE